MKFIKIYFCALLIYTLQSCSCAWHLKRAESKCGKPQHSVLTLHDTIVTPSITHDTIFKFYTRDTVIVHQKNLTVKYFYHTNDSTVYLSGNCKGDTIIKTIRVPYEKTVVKIDYFPKWVFWVLGALIILGIVFRILK